MEEKKEYEAVPTQTRGKDSKQKYCSEIRAVRNLLHVWHTVVSEQAKKMGGGRLFFASAFPEKVGTPQLPEASENYHAV